MCYTGAFNPNNVSFSQYSKLGPTPYACMARRYNVNKVPHMPQAIVLNIDRNVLIY